MSTVTPGRAEPPFVLAIDIGTSSVRTGLFDRLGRAIKGVEAREPHEIRTTAEGAAETDPDTLLELVWRCIDSVMVRSRALTPQIAAVAACTFVGNVMGADSAGKALTPLATYADTRSEGEVAGLRAEVDEAAVHDRTGCHLHPSYLPAYFRWFAHNKPSLFRQVAHWISIGEYLEWKLFGEARVSYSVASWTGLLNRRRLVWDEPLLALLPVRREQLSPLVNADVPARGLRPEFGVRWPALREIPWFPELGDGAAANIGSGCISPERVALTIGTTTALRTVVDHTVDHIPSGLWCYRVDSRRSLPGGALSEGGSVFAWMKNVLRLGSLSELDLRLSGLQPDSHSLTVLPFFSGERSPGWAGHARATIHGLSLATTPFDILHAGLEAVAYRVALVLELLRQVLPHEPQLVGSGGALISSPAWIKIISDVCGRPVAVSMVQEASGRGAALLALEALRILKDLKEAPDFVGTIYEPDLQRHGRYLEAIDRQKKLYKKLVNGISNSAIRITKSR